MTDYAQLTNHIRFGAELAHQIKNPLAALILQLDDLAQSATSPALIEQIDGALEQALRINLLIESILTSWRTVISHELVALDFNKLLSDITKNWTPKFAKMNRSIELKTSMAVQVLGCKTTQEQVIDVLIENSLQHGSGTTSIQLGVEKQWAVLIICDQGQGIHENVQTGLMTYGVTTTGNGIGLALAKKQILNDGGRLEIISMKPAVFKLFLLLDPMQHL